MKAKELILALAALSAAACVQEQTEAPAPRTITVTAYQPGFESTRTMVEDGGAKVLWQPGDKIKVFRRSDLRSLVFTSTNTEPAGVSEFVASTSPDDPFLDGSGIAAFYPGNDNVEYKDGHYTVWVPSEQVGIPGTFDPDAFISRAASQNGELRFKNVTAGFRFTLTQEGIERITLENLSGWSMTGTAEITDNDQLTLFTKTDRDAPKLITLTPKDGGTFKTGEWYYMVFLPWNMPRGFRLSFYQGDRMAEWVTDKAVHLSSGTFLSFSQIDRDIEFHRSSIDLLMDFYYAMDGPNWAEHDGWSYDSDLPLNKWTGIRISDDVNISILLSGLDLGLKGEIPESLGDLGDKLVGFQISGEPGVGGTLPASFAKLKKLKTFHICNSSMTALPDVFSQMLELRSVMIDDNPLMGGPMPASLGTSDALRTLTICSNAFTGPPPASYARHYEYLNLWDNKLSGPIPAEYLEGGHDEVARKLMAILCQQEGFGFDISDIDIPGYWPRGTVEDLSGNTFTFADVVSRNNYTVYLTWAPWCPNSKVLMPQLLDYYRKYRADGLEIIATVTYDEDGNPWEDTEGQMATIEKKGYGDWYNFYFFPYIDMTHPSATPSAEVYDNKGNLLFSSFLSYNGQDSRNRFCHVATNDLMPFLESVLGPAEGPDVYTSTDYSKDGEVITLQKATVGKGINIVFIGDGYTDKDMSAGGLYETLMSESMEEFFSIEPYKTFRNRFNVYAVKVVSRNDRNGNGYSTAIGVECTSNSISTGNKEKSYGYALKVPGITNRDNLLVGVLVNSRYGNGITSMDETSQSGVAYYASSMNDPDVFGITLRHEAGGHGFAFLDDEYSWRDEEVPAEHVEYRTRMYEQYGWYSNVDFTDDPAKVKWSAFLRDDRYKDEVGIFEGGSLYSKGTYRPSENSMMRYNYEYFNAPSRWAIYKRIMELSGESYSFQTFLEYDAVNRNKN